MQILLQTTLSSFREKTIQNTTIRLGFISKIFNFLIYILSILLHSLEQIDAMLYTLYATTNLVR